MSNSVRPHRRQPTRLHRPWDSPGKTAGVGCHFLLQCMKVKSESEVAQSCPTLSDPMDCSLPGSSVHGIFQARVLGAIAFSICLLGDYIKNSYSSIIKRQCNCGIVRKIFGPSSWHRAPKTFEISQVIRVIGTFFVTTEVILGVPLGSSGWELVPRQTKP